MPATSDTSSARALTEVVTKLRRALRSSVRADIAWERLPMAQVELLQTLTEMPAARMNDLADRLNLAVSTVSGLVGQMLTSNLVERDTDPIDRRAAVVTITATGRQQLTEWESANARRISASLKQLTAKDRNDIAAALPALDRLAAKLSLEPRGTKPPSTGEFEAM